MASLNLKKPVVFFDLETTGINIANDRIVEIAIFYLPFFLDQWGDIGLLEFID